jgi:hypothetical protein
MGKRKSCFRLLIFLFSTPEKRKRYLLLQLFNFFLSISLINQTKKKAIFSFFHYIPFYIVEFHERAFWLVNTYVFIRERISDVKTIIYIQNKHIDYRMDRRVESFYNKTSQKRIFRIFKNAVLLETVETSVIIVNDGSQTTRFVSKPRGRDWKIKIEKKSERKSGGKCRLFMNSEFSLYPYYWGYIYVCFKKGYQGKKQVLSCILYKVFSKAQISYLLLLFNNNNNNNGSSYIAHFTNVSMRFTISGGLLRAAYYGAIGLY